ncbi:MAG: hypothetical protein QGG36_29450, partial [Pirellulaceae bacterium]|nr:hypothetical protein [Pirellulaceae bacterium]
YVYEPTNTINLLALPTPTPDDHYLSFQTQSNVDLFPEDTLELTRTTQTVAANPPQDQRPEILVATLTRAVAARTRITPDIVKLAPYDGAKPGVIQDASRVVGMYSGMRLGAGEAVLESQLVPPPESIKSGIQSNDARSTDRAVDNSFDTIVEIESVELLTADSLVDGFVNPVQPPTTRLPALDFTGPIVETGPPRVATGLSLPRLTVEPLSTTLTEVVPQIESVSEASPVLPPNVQIRSTIAESAGPPAAGQTKNGTVYDRDASGTYTTSDPTVAATDASVPLPEGVLVQKSSSVDSLEPKSDATVPRGIRANGRPLPPVDPANKRVVTIIKSDGRVISGTIVSSDKKELKIQTDKGLVVVPRNEIDEIKDPRRSPIF